MKNSIKKKCMLLFSALFTFTIVFCWLANILFLGKFYMSRKEAMLRESYLRLDYVATKYGETSDEFKNIFEMITERNNYDVLILDSDMMPVISNVPNYEFLSDKLIGYFLGYTESTEILEKADKYTVQKSSDTMHSNDFLELWGVFSNGNLIVARTPVSSIKDSVYIANLFLMYVGLLAIAISIAIVYCVSTNITNPILQLVDISDRMAKLDFDARYEGDDLNEIGLLGNHINKLSDTLKTTISELKTANIELKNDLERKTEIDEMRTEFLSNVSHELKTPIALIQGYAEGLMDCVNDDEESKNFYCEVIADEASKMNNLVKSLLELNELEFGQNNVCLERFDIVEVIRNCSSNIDILLKQNEIKYIFNQDEPVFVWSDEFKVIQVFNNYLSNAIHYANGDEKVVKVSVTKKDDKVRISVFNTGNPIPEEAVPKLWTKFYKVDKARTREYGGSGVGLSIVKAAMDALNQKYGVINYENGVSFWFEVDGKSI